MSDYENDLAETDNSVEEAEGVARDGDTGSRLDKYGQEIDDPATVVTGEAISMAEFIEEFSDGLLDSIKTLNPPVYTGQRVSSRERVLGELKRKPFESQAEVVRAVTQLLVDENEPAAIINAEMGTGKTMMAIAAAAVMHESGYERSLVLSPPHLVYKWRREIKETIPNARVWILNGPDTLSKLLQIRQMRTKPKVPEFFVLGRVRMRLGFHWRSVFGERRVAIEGEIGRYAACPDCGELLMASADDDALMPMSPERAGVELEAKRSRCPNEACGSALWSLMHKKQAARTGRDIVSDALQQLPTIGPKMADKLLNMFGDAMLGSMLSDNIYEFVNLMDEGGELVFSDRQAARMERALSSFEFSYGQGGYQATEFIKRYLPQGFFGLLVVDEGHEYKNEGSAQGQAMGVLARKATKTLLLTGTLMGGYADDLFHLLWRLNPRSMIEDGFRPDRKGSMSAAGMGFMREHGVLKDIYKEVDRKSHRTARGVKISHRVAKAPGFGPKGIMRFVLPCTAFLKLKDIGGNVLPPYEEVYREVAMSEHQAEAYERMQRVLSRELKQALQRGDTTLLGVVLSVLLAWPDCAFRHESVIHPRTKHQLHLQPALFNDTDVMPKEAELIAMCLEQKARGRRVLVYSVYTGKRDTTARLKTLLDAVGLRVAVLRATVDAAKREDWVADQVDRGVDVLICNPELVKTGLDLLAFPTIVYMQSGYNVYTLQQASRRSWRIGQREAVEVYFLGYAGTAQTACLQLMSKKIAVSQSTSGDMPDSGLDVLNQSGDSIEVALAKQLIEA